MLRCLYMYFAFLWVSVTGHYMSESTPKSLAESHVNKLEGRGSWNRPAELQMQMIIMALLFPTNNSTFKRLSDYPTWVIAYHPYCLFPVIHCPQCLEKNSQDGFQTSSRMQPVSPPQPLVRFAVAPSISHQAPWSILLFQAFSKSSIRLPVFNHCNSNTWTSAGIFVDLFSQRVTSIFTYLSPSFCTQFLFTLLESLQVLGFFILFCFEGNEC